MLTIPKSRLTNCLILFTVSGLETAVNSSYQHYYFQALISLFIFLRFLKTLALPQIVYGPKFASHCLTMIASINPTSYGAGGKNFFGYLIAKLKLQLQLQPSWNLR